MSLTAFVAGSNPVALGASTTLTATFTGGSAVILPSGFQLASGVAYPVTPKATTTYTAVFTDSTTGAVSSLSVTLNVTVPTERKLTISGGTGVLVAGMNTYFIAGDPTNYVTVTPNVVSLPDHKAQTNEETIVYDVDIAGKKFQLTGKTKLIALLTEFGLTWS